jgi:hypothetical protein
MGSGSPHRVLAPAGLHPTAAVRITRIMSLTYIWYLSKEQWYGQRLREQCDLSQLQMPSVMGGTSLDFIFHPFKNLFVVFQVL